SVFDCLVKYFMRFLGIPRLAIGVEQRAVRHFIRQPSFDRLIKHLSSSVKIALVAVKPDFDGYWVGIPRRNSTGGIDADAGVFEQIVFQEAVPQSCQSLRIIWGLFRSSTLKLR